MSEEPNKNKNREYDLEERLANFAEKVVELCKKVPKNTETVPILDQLMRSATSMVANYYEANGASSKKDFRNKSFICKKESKETGFWLRLLAKAHNPVQDECRELWKENYEYTLIFSKITATLRKGERQN